jgi:biotin transport system substrate-specific component
MATSAARNLGQTAAHLPLVDYLRQTAYGKVFVLFSATMFVAVCAHVSVPLPYTPVPLVLSDFAVLLVGMVLGPEGGFLAMIAYLAEGALGMPVFSPQGPGGVVQLVGPTGGYLFSYPIAAAVAGLTGVLVRKGRLTFSAGILCGTVAIATILACGALWMGHKGYMNTASTWSLAVTPFLFGSLAKIVAASVIFGSTRRWLCS